MQTYLEAARQLPNGKLEKHEKRRFHELELAVLQQRELVARLQADLDSIHYSNGWRLLLRYYAIRNWLMPVGSWRHALVNALRRGVRRVTTMPAPARERQELAYKAWIAKTEPDAAALALQRLERFLFRPRISLVVPVYEPSTAYLEATIESVLAQTYADWELCLADGGSKDPEVKRLLREYAAKDSRIRVTYLPHNKGIAGNSNAALALATGSFVGLLDHDDTLAPFALHEVVKNLNEHPQADFLYSDEDRLDAKGERCDVNFKPAWSPELLRSHNYVCHLIILNREMVDSIGGFREGFEGSQDYDLVLRATEQARQILHIPKVLYHWRRHSDALTVGPRLPEAKEAGRRALEEHLERQGVAGTVRHNVVPDTYQVVRSLPSKPLISIIIPNKDQPEILARCLESVRESSYPNYEILLVENRSNQPETFEYYQELSTWPQVRMLTYDRPFNYAALNNYAATQAAGEVLLLLNNDTEVLTPDWLERMVEHALRPDVGAVGAKLYYPNNTIQHAGVIVGIGGVAGHSHRSFPRQALGYTRRLATTQNLSAVTAACLMLRKQVFDEVGGFDTSFVVAFNDVDLCMQIRRQGYWIVWTPHAELYHHESKTRGRDDLPENRARFDREAQRFRTKWWNELSAGDPFYSPHLSLVTEDFALAG
jgi:O-antigen biosynthesis protein